MNPNQFENKRRDALLRVEAEAQLAHEPSREAASHPSRALLHEIRVNQIELEMQNEELRRAQIELEDSRDRYLDLYAFAPLGYFTVSREGMIAECNLTGATHLGVERKKLLRSRFDTFVDAPDRERWHHLFANMIKREIGRQIIELGVSCNDGSVFYGRLDCLRVEKDDMPPMIRIALTDISERKQAEEQLRQLNETLELRVREELSRNREKDLLLLQQSRLAAIGEVIHNVSHHWRQPLSAVSLVLANIKDTYEFNELNRDYLNREVAGGQRLIQEMSATIDRFRGFFSADGEKRRFLVCDVVNEAIGLLEPALNGSDIVIDCLHSADALSVWGYPRDFARVVLGVLVNARDAIIRKGAAGVIRISAKNDGNTVTLAISDNGGGVPADALDRIFDPYFTTRDANKGLGLYLAKTIMNSMGGTISLLNSGDGAEVLLALPLEAPEQVGD